MNGHGPAFDFYPERWTHGTRHLTKVERCDYLDLLCQQWTDGRLPADDATTARLLGYRKATDIPEAVLIKFPRDEHGFRRNARLEQEREKQLERIAKRKLGASKTNQKRWGKRVAGESLSDRLATPERVVGESPPTTNHQPPIVLLGKEPKLGDSAELEFSAAEKPKMPEAQKEAISYEKETSRDSDTKTPPQSETKAIPGPQIDAPAKKQTAKKPDDVSSATWAAFIEHRKGKKAPITEIAMAAICREASAAGYTVEEALITVLERGSWVTFRAEYVAPKFSGPQKQHTAPRDEAQLVADMRNAPTVNPTDHPELFGDDAPPI